MNANIMIEDAVLRVGDGRGFVVEHLNYLGHPERIVITAAHCLPFFPPCHPGSYLHERTYEALLGRLGDEPTTVWAECFFADPIGDVAVLGTPDNQALSNEADAYERLLEDMEPLLIADAPPMGHEYVNLGAVGASVVGEWIKRPTPGQGDVRVLSLDGQWLDARVVRYPHWLSIEPSGLVVGGMSGSPIIMNGRAISLCSTGHTNPVLVEHLPPWLMK